jgi:Fe2+ transport system protein FeoA
MPNSAEASGRLLGGPARTASRGALRLADLPVGFIARVHHAHVDPESRSLLRALGLTDGSLLRVCKQGEPCVVQVRATRIGICSRIARQVFVIPAEGPDSGDLPCR